MQKVCIFDRVLCIIILTVSSIKTEYWCIKLFYFVLSAVGKRVIRPAFRQAYGVGYLDPPIQ